MIIKKDTSDDQTKLWTTWFKDGDFKNHILNEKNIPITKEYIHSIFKKYNFNHKVKNLENFQLAMVHVSYLNRCTLIEKTAKLLKDVIPIEDNDKLIAMPLKEQCYGRLEYLGDAIIHAILAEYLFDRYKEQDEGFLTKLRAKIEKDVTLSELSRKIGLHKYAIVARNLEQSDGRNKDVHLAEDIFEAFFGALSLEVKYDKCKDFFISIIENELDIAELIYNDDNYKDRLMRHFHQLRWNEPVYHEDVSQQKNIKEGCQEIRSFTTYVKDPTGKIIGVGVGNSKTKSQQNAAYDTLVKLNVIKDDDDAGSDYYGEVNSQHSNSDIELSDSDSDYFE